MFVNVIVVDFLIYVQNIILCEYYINVLYVEIISPLFFIDLVIHPSCTRPGTNLIVNDT